MMTATSSATTFACSCGFAAARDAQPFHCANAGKDGADHVLKRKLTGASPEPFTDPDPNPFIRYRQFTHAWHAGMEDGMSDAQFISLVRHFDDKVAAVDGHGFRVTPFERRLDGQSHAATLPPRNPRGPAAVGRVPAKRTDHERRRGRGFPGAQAGERPTGDRRSSAPSFLAGSIPPRK